MKKWVEKVLDAPRVAHLVRANNRFGNRLGSQFAGAITYFSILAMVPIIMFAFAMVGMTLTEIRPEWLDIVKRSATRQISGQSMQEKIGTLIDNATSNWATIGIVGLLAALYAAQGWISNLKNAVQAQWRPMFEKRSATRSWPMERVVNIGIFLAMLLIIAVLAVTATMGTSLSRVVLHAAHIDATPFAKFATFAVSFLISVFVGWVLFVFLYRVLPEMPVRWRPLWQGALIASLGFAALQSLFGFILKAFSQNAGTALFGSLIVLMLSLNLFATLTLFVAAWIATYTQPAIPFQYSRFDLPLKDQQYPVDAVPGHWEAAADDKERQEAEKAAKEREKLRKKPDYVEHATFSAQQYRRPIGPQPPPIPQIQRTRTTAFTAGWGIGAATGAGLGALIISALLPRHRDKV